MAFCLVNRLNFWVFLASSVNFIGMLFISATYAQILRSPHYNLPSELIMNVNVCSSIGVLYVLPLGAYLAGKILDRLEKRDRGVRETSTSLSATSS